MSRRGKGCRETGYLHQNPEPEGGGEHTQRREGKDIIGTGNRDDVLFLKGSLKRKEAKLSMKNEFWVRDSGESYTGDAPRIWAAKQQWETSAGGTSLGEQNSASQFEIVWEMQEGNRGYKDYGGGGKGTLL